MRNASLVRLAAPKPRKFVIRVLIALGKATSVRHDDGQRRKASHDRRDLAQRVRDAANGEIYVRRACASKLFCDHACAV